MSEIQPYRDLRVWQGAMSLAEAAYVLTKDFPRAEVYGMTSQIRRSAVSVAANIAEGYGRESTGAYVNFLRTAQGSLKELETHVILGGRVGLIAGDQPEGFLSHCDEVGRMLRALIRSIERQASE